VLLLKQLSEERFALNQAAIVAATDQHGKITYVNDKFCEISGYSRDELLGQDHRLLNSREQSKHFFRQLWGVIQSGRTWRGEICNRRKDGSLYWVNTTIVPFLSDDGLPIQYLAIRQDITELKLAQRRIMEQQEALISASKLSATGEMAAAITHEINNPLGVILGRCEMLKSMVEQGITDPQQLMKVVEHIEVTGKRIEKIVKSMKSLSHGGDDEPMFPTSIYDILSDSLELCFQRFRNHGINLKVSKPQEDFSVECRSHQLAQVIVNLLNNSFDAIQELPEKWVELVVSRENENLKISVTDSGPGITLENQRKLFEPFFSTKRVQYGTGLGLSISKNICRKHQGDLTYNSSAKNTQFIVKIPLKQKWEAEMSL